MSDLRDKRGQFFTVHPLLHETVSEMIAGMGEPLVLEPSFGSGELIRVVNTALPQAYVEGCEIDRNITHLPHLDAVLKYGDFFQHTFSEKFDLVLMNPPYVAWKNVEKETKTNARYYKRRYSDKVNLYHLFIDRSIDLLVDGGSIIGIVPADWLRSTSANPLRGKLAEHGHISRIVLFNNPNERLFPDASLPSLMIFHWVKTPDHSINTVITEHTGKGIVEYSTLIDYSAPTWYLTPQSEHGIKLGDVFSVKVGTVSGADSIYCLDAKDPSLIESLAREGGVVKYVGSKGVVPFLDPTGLTWGQLGDRTKEYLEQHKGLLISRGIRSYTEENWWEYGAVRNRDLMLKNAPRIYVPSKTRKMEPFFTNHQCGFYTGAILGLFPKYGLTLDILEVWVNYFNSDEFRKQLERAGLVARGRLELQPKTLEELLLPNKIPDEIMSIIQSGFCGEETLF